MADPTRAELLVAAALQDGAEERIKRTAMILAAQPSYPPNQALLARARALLGSEWKPIDSAPKDREIILGMFRAEFTDPIVMNSIWLDREERGAGWSDWHGLPAPTHWQPLRFPAPPSSGASDG